MLQVRTQKQQKIKMKLPFSMWVGAFLRKNTKIFYYIYPLWRNKISCFIVALLFFDCSFFVSQLFPFPILSSKGQIQTGGDEVRLVSSRALQGSDWFQNCTQWKKSGSSWHGSAERSLTSVHEDTGIWRCCDCDAGAAVALIWPLAWEPPYAMGIALKRQKKNEKSLFDYD